MNIKKETTSKKKDTVTIDLDKLSQAVEKLAPGNYFMKNLASFFRHRDSPERSNEEEIVLGLSHNMHTVLTMKEYAEIREVLIRVASLMGLLETAASAAACVSPDDLSNLAGEALEKLYGAKSLLEGASPQTGKEA